VMNYSDPPEHQRRRRIVSSAFSPVRMRDMAESMRHIISEQLDSIAGQPGIEVVHDLTKPISVRFILGHLMRVPEADQEIFHRVRQKMRSRSTTRRSSSRRTGNSSKSRARPPQDKRSK